jgi:hypothetical protein
MRPLLSLCRAGARFSLGCLLSFLMWSLWTLLAVAFIAQLWIAASREISLPPPLLRMLERHLSAPGFTVRVGNVIFDPSGHLLVKDFSLVMDSFGETILRCSVLHTKTDPWGLIVGNPDARQLDVSDLNVVLPAPLSPTGRNEECISNLNAVLVLERKELSIVELTAKSRNASVCVNGSLRLEPLKNPKSSAEYQIQDYIRSLLEGLRRYVALYPQLDNIPGARVQVQLTPSDSRGAIADVMISADSLHLNSPVELTTGPLALSTRVPLAGDSPTMVRVDLRTDSLSSPLVQVEGLSACVRGIMRPRPFSFEPKLADLSADRVSAKDVVVRAPSLRLEPAPSLPSIHFDLTFAIEDALVEAQGKADIKERSAVIQVRTAPTDALVALAGKLIKRDLRKFVLLSEPARFSGEVSLAPGGKLSKATGWIEARNLNIYRVPINSIEGAISWDGVHFAGTQAFLRQGDNFARGSYEMDAPTRDFRFLLDGRLRPMDIAPWFKEWWPNFWTSFDFAKQIPEASVDVKGRWGDPSASLVHVGADARDTIIRSVPFAHAWTEVYVLSHSVYVPYLHGVRPEGEARGWFYRLYDENKGTWERIEFNVAGNIFPDGVAPIFETFLPEITAPFVFAQVPTLHVRGRVEGPAGTLEPKQLVDVEVSSKGSFKYHGFPLENVSATARWSDHTLKLSHFNASYAQGLVEGHALVDTAKESKQLEFEASIKNARLGEAASQADQFVALRTGKPRENHSGAEKIADAKLDLSLSAKGRYDSPLSFHGTGQASISGAELTHIRMFGLLSELLRFTTLRFTSVKTNFEIDGPNLVFPSFRIFGRNSAIEAKGHYSLEHKTLDFNAKVWPLDESQGLVQEAMKLVLSPFSHVFEVKLAGTIADPHWSFANNPFRMLTPAETPSGVGTAPASPPETTPPTPPKPVPASSPEGQKP